MTPDPTNPASAAARTGSGGAVSLSSSSAADVRIVSPTGPNPQEDNRASEITCASMRAQELRECLIREISRTIAIGLQAQAALFDGDDDAALASLFRHWFVLRDDVRPLLLELRDVLKQGGSP
jgi:hypothetical protein